jgi:hypothetical protein
MTNKQLESMVSNIKKPNLNQDEVRKLLDFGDDNIVPIQKARLVPQRVVQPVPEVVTQPVPQRVVQSVPQRVVQPVPQKVVQPVPQKVVQPVPQIVAQPVPQKVTQPVAQSLWVAQNDTLLDVMSIAKNIGQKVVKPYKSKAIKKKSEMSAYDQSVWEGVEKLREYTYNLLTIEDRKKFVLDIGWGIGQEGKRIISMGERKSII